MLSGVGEMSGRCPDRGAGGGAWGYGGEQVGQEEEAGGGGRPQGGRGGEPLQVG